MFKDNTIRSKDEPAHATIALVVSTGLCLKASPLVHATLVPWGNMLALVHLRARRALLALRMMTKTQRLHAWRAQTEHTLDVARANVKRAHLEGLIWTTIRRRHAYNVGLVRYG